MTATKAIGVVVLVAVLGFAGGYLFVQEQGARQAVNDLQTENEGLRTAVQDLTSANQEIRGDLNRLTETMAAAETDPGERARAIHNGADWLAHLTVELQLKTPQALQQWFFEDPQHMIFVRQDPQDPNMATAILSGSLFMNASGQYRLLTAGHIRDDAYTITRIDADFKNGESAEFELLGYDSNLDAALLRPKDPNFEFHGQLPRFGVSANLQVQQTVVHMGSPLTLPYVCSAGRINSLRVGNAFLGGYNSGYRQAHLIMHDAKIDAGSSGGPLLNLNGEIVGINVMVSRRFNVWSLTVPVDDIWAIMADLESGVQR